MGRNRRITDWDPEDAAAWDTGNGQIARRELFYTVAADHSSGTETPTYWLFPASYVITAALMWRLDVRRHASAADMAGLNIEPARV